MALSEPEKPPRWVEEELEEGQQVEQVEKGDELVGVLQVEGRCLKSGLAQSMTKFRDLWKSQTVLDGGQIPVMTPVTNQGWPPQLAGPNWMNQDGGNVFGDDFLDHPGKKTKRRKKESVEFFPILLHGIGFSSMSTEKPSDESR